MSFLPTASKLELAQRCEYPWTSGIRWQSGGDSDALRYGNAFHKAAELAATGSGPDVRAIATEYRLSPADTRRLELAAGHANEFLLTDAPEWRKAELAMAYDHRNGVTRALPADGHRDYSRRQPWELVGTADLVSMLDILTVDDWKTGRRENVEPIATNAQMGFLGLAAARLFGVGRVRVRLLYASEDGIDVDSTEFDELSLGSIALDISDMVHRLHTPGSVPSPGSHCRWCPVQVECPATKAAMEAVSKASALTFPMSVSIQSPEHAAYTRHRLKVVREACDEIETHLKDWVRENGPVEVAPGRLYGIKEVRKERVDIAAPGAYQALARTLGDAADKAVSLSTSKAEIHRAVVSVPRARGEATRVEAALYEELRKLGAITETTHEQLTEFEERKEKKTA